jgi:hypothetical protein
MAVLAVLPSAPLYGVSAPSFNFPRLNTQPIGAPVKSFAGTLAGDNA